MLNDPKHLCLCAVTLVAMASSVAPAQAQVFARSDDTRPKPPEYRARERRLKLDLGGGGAMLSGNVEHLAANGSLALTLRLAEQHELFVDGRVQHSFFAGAAALDKDSASLLYVFAALDFLNLYAQSTHARNRFLKLSYRTTNSLGVCLHTKLEPQIDPAMISLGVTPENEWWEDGHTEMTWRGTLRLNATLRPLRGIELGVDVILAPALIDPGDFHAVADAYLQLAIVPDRLSLRLAVTDEYDSRPPAGVAHNDLSVLPSLVVHTGI